MKTITIRLPDVEAAMLVELQKIDKEYSDLGRLLARLVRDGYFKTGKNR